MNRRMFIGSVLGGVTAALGFGRSVIARPFNTVFGHVSVAWSEDGTIPSGVVDVTNHNSDGPGSLKWAFAQNPHVVRFKCGPGLIVLKEPVVVRAPIALVGSSRDTEGR